MPGNRAQINASRLFPTLTIPIAKPPALPEDS